MMYDRKCLPMFSRRTVPEMRRVVVIFVLQYKYRYYEYYNTY